MRLVSLFLENIKSYVSEEIRFFPGVNFISGINGAGKSTIIEAIGFVLFDANPFSNLKQFIREGAKSAEISLIVEGADERLYRIVRRLRLPSGGSWAVFDVETDSEFNELHGNQDVKLWLTENLGIDRGLEPSLLFEDVIGISQGKFTTPFLEKGVRRKQIFNTILQLESYREAFEKSSGFSTILDKRILELEGDKKGLLSLVQDFEECRDNLKGAELRVGQLDKGLISLHSQLKGLEKEIRLQEGLKERIQKGERELQALELRMTSLGEQKISLEKYLADAVQCRKKTEGAVQGYKEYLVLQEKQQEMDIKRKRKEALDKEMQSLSNQIASLEAEVTGAKDNRRILIENNQREMEELRNEGEREAACLREAQQDRDKGQEQIGYIEGERALWLFPDEALGRISQTQTVLALLSEKREKIKEERINIEQNLVGLEQRNSLAGKVPSFEGELARIQEDLNLLRTRVEGIEEKRQATEGGICPFLQVPCSNIEEDLETHFAQEIKGLEPQILLLNQKKAIVEENLKKAREALSSVKLFHHQKERLTQLFEQELETKKNIREEWSAIYEFLEASRLKLLVESFDEVMERVSEVLTIAGEDIDFISKGADKVKELGALVSNYCMSYSELKFDGSQDKLPDISLLAGILKAIKELGSEIWKKNDLLLNGFEKKIAGQLAGHNVKLKTLRDNYQKVKGSLQRLQDDKSIEKKELELKDKRQKIRGLEEGLALFSGIDKEWDNNQRKLTKLQPLYIQYVQNIEGAEKLEGLQRQLVEHVSKEKTVSQDINLSQVCLSQLKTEFKADLLLDLKNRRDIMVQEKGQKEEELKHSLREVERYRGQVAEKERVRQEIKILQKNILTHTRAWELLRIARNTLNGSGEKMAQVYRQYLGREADIIYQQVSKENVHLKWDEDYEVKLIDNLEGRERTRSFNQLSGGEKMTAALAIRLALLKHLSGLGIGFFDEPTANLDEKRRNNLARIIPDITKDFRQIFVISHDDTFDAITENVIMLTKVTGKGTTVIRH